MSAPPTFTYSPWRHGGWYVDNVRYPSGACGCVSRNYTDRKWRIACDPRPFDKQPTFKCRDDAARAEWHLARDEGERLLADGLAHKHGDGIYRVDTREWWTEKMGVGACWRSDCDRGVK